jgi:general secretion pathway protein D
MHARGEGALGGLVRVLPMSRLNAVLIVSAQSRYIEAARRIYAMVERGRRQTIRSWQVYYLQNGDADDVAYLLQQAFTPNNVTAQPSSVTHPRQGIGQGTSLGVGQGAASGIGGGGVGAGGVGGAGGLGAGGIAGGAGGLGTAGQAGGGAAFVPPAAGGAGAAPGQPAQAANPLLGGLDQSGGGGEAAAEAMRILPDTQNNSVLIYATPHEAETVTAMLRKIDILPLQVRIDAVIVEVTLNDALQYGTQFFFKGNGLNVLLNSGNPTAAAIGAASGANPAAFVISGQGSGGAPVALSLLQAVTTIHVLSSPELVVVDNQPARLQVGDLVPYLTSTATSTLTSGAPIVNSVNYQPTGVILQVTPRVNSSGLVTLDVEQEVSDIDTTITSATTGISSPAFLERNVTSRVVVQDGQTVGIAGLIKDSVTRSNQGLPWLKDVPLLGALFGSQNNQRARTELLVLITPHVMRDQREARALTEDMREALPNAAAVPDEVQHLPLSGSADPNQRLRDRLRTRLQPADPPPLTP